MACSECCSYPNIPDLGTDFQRKNKIVGIFRFDSKWGTNLQGERKGFGYGIMLVVHLDGTIGDNERRELSPSSGK